MIPVKIWVGMNSNIVIPPDKILKIVQHHFEIKPDLMFSQTRKQEVVRARKIALYLMHYFSINKKKSLAELASLAGYDSDGSHSTALYHINKVKSNIEIYSDWRKTIEELKNRCINFVEATDKDLSKETIEDAKLNPDILDKY